MNTLERGESSGMLGRGLGAGGWGLGALLGDSWGLVTAMVVSFKAAVRRPTSYCVGVIFQYSAGLGRGWRWWRRVVPGFLSGSGNTRAGYGSHSGTGGRRLGLRCNRNDRQRPAGRRGHPG